jgi:hypothetical protein
MAKPPRQAREERDGEAQVQLSYFTGYLLVGVLRVSLK